MIFLLSSCSKLIPAEFWKNYKTELIVENVNDQGPYGGNRAIYWKTKTVNTFDSTNVIEFAEENGWELTGKEKFKSEIIRNWKIENKLIFPLSYLGFQPKLENDETYQNFPRWINSNITLYKFKTNFITIEPGTDNSTEENGFILINENETEMSVYSLWGE